MMKFLLLLVGLSSIVIASDEFIDLDWDQTKLGEMPLSEFDGRLQDAGMNKKFGDPNLHDLLVKNTETDPRFKDQNNERKEQRERKKWKEEVARKKENGVRWVHDQIETSIILDDIAVPKDRKLKAGDPQSIYGKWELDDRQSMISCQNDPYTTDQFLHMPDPVSACDGVYAPMWQGTNANVDQECQKPEMWVRLLKTPTTTGDPAFPETIAASDAEVGKIRILDFHIRSRDRLVFLFGVYQNKERHSGEWDTGEMPHGDCFFAIMDHFGEILDSVIFETEFVGATVVGTECRTFSVQKSEGYNAVVGVGTRYATSKTSFPLDTGGTYYDDTNHRQVLIMRVNDVIDGKFDRTHTNAKIWSQSPDQNAATSYPQFAGGVDITLDGQIFVTGWQIGYDFNTDPPQLNCFILRLNYDLTLQWAKTFTTANEVKCQYIATTRHGDNIYVAGFVRKDISGTEQRYLMFWHIMGAAFKIEDATAIEYPSNYEMSLRRIIIPQLQVYNRPANAPEHYSGANVYFCGNYWDNSNVESYYFGYINTAASFTVGPLLTYGSPDGGTEKGGDCAITPDGTYFVGGFATSHTTTGIDDPDFNILVTKTTKDAEVKKICWRQATRTCPKTYSFAGSIGEISLYDDGCLDAYNTASNAYWTDVRENMYTWSSCKPHVFEWWRNTDCKHATINSSKQSYAAGSWQWTLQNNPYNQVTPSPVITSDYRRVYFLRDIWLARPGSPYGTVLNDEYGQTEKNDCENDCDTDGATCSAACTTTFNACPGVCTTINTACETTCDGGVTTCITGCQDGQTSCDADCAGDTVCLDECATYAATCEATCAAGDLTVCYDDCLNGVITAGYPDIIGYTQCNVNCPIDYATCTDACDATSYSCGDSCFGSYNSCGGRNGNDDCNDRNGDNYPCASGRDATTFPYPKWTFCNKPKCGEFGTLIGTANLVNHPACSYKWSNATVFNWVQEQNCLDRNVAHYDWFIFKMTTASMTGSIDIIPQNAAYFGDYGEAVTKADFDAGVTANKKNYYNQGYQDPANEFLQTIQVDEWGFIYIAGYTTSVYFSRHQPDPEALYALYAKTHWEFTWEMEDYYCDYRCMASDDPARWDPTLKLSSTNGECNIYGCEYYGTRFVRPMQFTNDHLEAGAFMKNMKNLVFDVDDSPAGYIDLHLYPINEHIDSDNMLETDENDLYAYFGRDGEMDGDELTPCETKQNLDDMYFGLKYDQTAPSDYTGFSYVGLHFDSAFKRPCVNLPGTNFPNAMDNSEAGTQWYPDRTVMNTYTLSDLTDKLQYELIGFASSGFKVREFRISKNDRYSIQMPSYCTYIKYNFKYYYGDADWRTKFTDDVLSGSHISYVRSPPVSVGQMQENEGIYWTMWGAYDLNDELHDNTMRKCEYAINKSEEKGSCNNGCGKGGGIRIKNFGNGWEEYEFVDSFKCGYDDYSEWHDEWQPADPTSKNNNWIQTLNRRQQFNLIKWIIDDFTIAEPRMIVDIPDPNPTKGQTTTFVIDPKVYFTPQDDVYGCYKIQVFAGNTDVPGVVRQLPYWIQFYEGNSTLVMQPDDQDKSVALDFQCCNKIDQCTTNSFSITPTNKQVTQHYTTKDLVLQFDVPRDLGQSYQFVNDIVQYEETNLPDKQFPDPKNVDRYDLSDHWHATIMDADYQTNLFTGVDYIGQYYGQITSDTTSESFDYGWGDQWDQPDEASLNIKVNHMPYATGLLSDDFGLLDPTNAHNTTYFNPIFPWANDDDEGPEAINMDLSGICQDDEGDQIYINVTRSDGTTRPDWLGFDDATCLLYGKPPLAYSSEKIELKITCYDKNGGQVDFYRTLLVNSKPKHDMVTDYKQFDIALGVGFRISLGSILTDPDSDLLTFDYVDSSKNFNSLGIYIDYYSNSLFGTPTHTGIKGWYGIRATDPHGSFKDIFVKINVTDYKPVLDFTRIPPDQYFQVDFPFVFRIQDNIITDKRGAMTWVVSSGVGGFYDWLAFVPTSNEFFGQHDTIGVFPVKVMAFSTVSTSSKYFIFNIHITPNHNPKVNMDLYPPDVHYEFNGVFEVQYGFDFSYTVPMDLFWDPLDDEFSKNVNATLTCSMSHSHPLQSPLTYNPGNRTVSGLIQDVGTYWIDFTFTDDQGLSIYANFKVVVTMRSIFKTYQGFVEVSIVSVSCIVALMVYFFYLFEYHTSVTKGKTGRAEIQQKKMDKVVDTRFKDYSLINVKFVLPELEDLTVTQTLKNTKAPIISVNVSNKP